jgi:hypothetical protein
MLAAESVSGDAHFFAELAASEKLPFNCLKQLAAGADG